MPVLVAAVAFKFEVAFGEFAEGIEEAGISAGVIGDFGFEDGGVEIREEVVEAQNGDAETGLVEQLRVVLVNEFGGEIEAGAHFVEAGLFFEPVLITAGEPAGDVGVIEVVPFGGDLFSNGGIGGAVAEQSVDLVPDFAWEAGYFAVAARGIWVGFGRATGWDGRRRRGGMRVVRDRRPLRGVGFHDFLVFGSRMNGQRE